VSVGVDQGSNIIMTSRININNCSSINHSHHSSSHSRKIVASSSRMPMWVGDMTMYQKGPGGGKC